MKDAMGASALAADLMIHRRHYEKGNGRGQQEQRSALYGFCSWGKLLKQLLEGTLKGEAEQNLRSQNQEPGFIQSGLQAGIEFGRHCWITCSTPTGWPRENSQLAECGVGLNA
jgi:hypothetical protein